MSHPPGAIRNYPSYSILTSLRPPTPPLQLGTPRDPATTLLFLEVAKGRRGWGRGWFERGGGEEEVVWEGWPGWNTTSASPWLPFGGEGGYTWGVTRVQSLQNPKNYPLFTWEKFNIVYKTFLNSLLPCFPFRDLRCLHRFHV